MKKLNTQKFLILMILPLFFGCQKSDISSNNNSNAGVASSLSVEYYQNPNNPYDYYGEIHNNGLDYVMSMTISPPADTTAILIAAVKAYGIIELSLEVEDMEQDIEDFMQVLDDAMTESSDSVELAIQYLISNSNLGSIGKAYMNNLVNLTLQDDETNIPALISSIKSIETTIANHYTLPSGDKEILLTFSSVLRHSLHYWSQEVIPHTHFPDFVPSDDVSGKLRDWVVNNWKKITKVAISDALRIIPVAWADITGTIIVTSVLASVLVGI